MSKRKDDPPVTKGPEQVTGVTFGFQLTVLRRDTIVGTIRAEGKRFVLDFTAESGLWPKSADYETVEEAKTAATKAPTAKPERFVAQQRGFDSFPSDERNPYEPGSNEHVLWLNGWNIAFMLDKRSAESV